MLFTKRFLKFSEGKIHHNHIYSERNKETKKVNKKVTGSLKIKVAPNYYRVGTLLQQTPKAMTAGTHGY